MNKKTIILLALLFLPVFIFPDTVETTIDIDAGATINTFRPVNIFGNNTNGWASPVNVKDRIQAAGNFLLRYPGGSWGDSFFWNGSGDYDKDGNWVPSATDYSMSRMAKDNGILYSAAKMIDNDSTTAWRSNADTDFPNSQWVYMDLQSKMEVNRVVITWGNEANKDWPYAKKFDVQYWDIHHDRQWMPYDDENSGWITTTAINQTGNGGTQEVTFTAVTTQYIRILMTESSAGPNGTYSIAEIKAFKDKNWIPLPNDNAIVASSANTAAELGDRKIFGFDDYMDFMNSFTPKGIPLIIVNVGTGTPQLAASWVKYANITKKYGIKYWEIGNENGGQWEAGGPMNVYDYARKYIELYEAMKAVDPSITLLAQCPWDSPSGAYDGVPGLQAFADRLAKEKKENYVDGWVIHQYPDWNKQVNDLLASPKSGMDKIEAALKKHLAKYPKLAETPVWITEFNTSDHVLPHDITVHLENGLWLSQYLCEFISHFGSRGYTCMWDVLNGGNAISDPNGGDAGYMQSEGGSYQYQERAHYWTMKMLTNYWSAPGDDKEHKMVDAKSGDPMLATYSDLRPDGSLTLLVVNKDPENKYKAAISIKGFVPDSEAKAWSFDKTNYKWETDSAPYHADPDNPPTESSIKDVSAKFSYSFQPYSITVLEFKKAEKAK